MMDARAGCKVGMRSCRAARLATSHGSPELQVDRCVHPCSQSRSAKSRVAVRAWRHRCHVREPITAGWRERLHARLVGQPTPLLVLPDHIWTAASLWAGSRQWVRALREAGLERGDRVVCALPAGAAFVQLLIASLWDGYTLAPVAPRDVDEDGAEALLAMLDARLLVLDSRDVQGVRPRHCFVPGDAGWPDRSLPPLRVATHGVTPDVCMLLRTSGTSGAPTWIALSDANVLAVLDSHAPFVAPTDGCVLSVLPWYHAFGLVLGLLMALLHAREIVRDPDGGRDLQLLLDLANSHPITSMDLVPGLATRLFAEARGAVLLRRLNGGVVGGAPVSALLATQLQSTRLRVGYGQTEAAPGIALGEPGTWSARVLGRAIGCDVRVDADGVLAFRGPNACLGRWTRDGLERRDSEAWLRTGDLVETMDDGDYRFIGRATDSFKLSNGRMVQASHYENAIRLRWPSVREVMLRSNGEDGIEMLITSDANAPSDADVRTVLGALGERLGVVTRIGTDAWQRTAKGEVDRRRPVKTPIPVRPRP